LQAIVIVFVSLVQIHATRSDSCGNVFLYGFAHVILSAIKLATVSLVALPNTEAPFIQISI